MNLKLIVGLGNPGSAYHLTRHNWGFYVLDRIQPDISGAWRKASFSQAMIAKSPEWATAWMVKPLCYMNLSGIVVQECMRWWKVAPEELLVLVDDINLPLGKLRLRAKGSDGGHNGLASIEQMCGTNRYIRLRGGVGFDKNKNMADYVLGKFQPNEMEEIEKMSDRAIDGIKILAQQGLEQAMCHTN